MHVIRSEDGFTLTEMLVAAVVGTIVMLGALALLDMSHGLSRSVDERVDTTSRARVAMEQITKVLRSQVCLRPGTAAITNGQDTSITFYAYMGSGTTFSPERHTITWNPATRQVVDYAFSGTGTAPDMTYGQIPTRTHTVASNVDPVAGRPIFSYYTWTGSGQVTPTQVLATPLSSADAQRTVRVAVEFKVSPDGNGRDRAKHATTLQSEVYARTADPNLAGGPGLPDCG